MSGESPENEWELSKENVQPLRQGRKISSLNAGLKQLSGEQISRIKEEKHAFEAELRTYTEEDPLEVWYKYILWAEQTFPKGGRDSNLTTILERCVRQFKDEDKYSNDERYIYAWMKMADICSDPLEIYKFMYDQNIGCELSCFYEGWACLLEQLGNYKKADAIFQNGLTKNARPYENLQQRHEDFQKRVARRMLNGADNESANSPDQGDQHRQVLSQLRTLGKQKQAPINRTGSAVQGSAGVLSGAKPKSTSNIKAGGVQIYCDENSDPHSLPPQTGQWSTAPKREVTNKENEKKAGIWTKQKMSKPSVSVPINAVSSYKQLSFSVHEDKNNDQNMWTPAKKPEIDSKKVLSSRKQEKDSTSSYLKTMSLSQDNTERPMYCKEKIYLGVEEYSFEELRSIRWLKKEEKRLHDEEQKAVEEIRLKLVEERQQLLDEAERVRQQRLKLQQEEQNMLEVARRQRIEHQQQMELDRHAEIKRQQEILEVDIQARLQEQMSHSNSKSQNSARQLMFDDGCHGNTENIPPHMMAQLQSSSSKHNQQGPAGNHSLNSSSRTPNSFVKIGQPQSSEKSFDRTMSGAPSPTVNTKEAIRLVMGMFNASLELNKPGAGDDVDMEELQPAVSQEVPQGSGMPFAIYDESQEPQASTQKPTSALFSVFQDTEASSAPLSVNKSSRNGSAEPMVHQSDHGMMGNNQRGHRLQSLTHPMFDDCEGIESHPRDDITLAPVGSHLSFAASARVASTPFNPNSSGSGARNSPVLDMSDIEMQTDQVLPLSINAPEPMLVNQVSGNQQVSQEQSVNNSMANLSAKNLSPIMEGSSDESSAASQLSQSSHYQHGIHQPLLKGGKLQLTPVLDQSEDTRNLLQAVDERNLSTHVIDMSAYMPPEMDEKTEQLMSTSILIVDPKDPFDAVEREQMLSCLKTSLHHMDTYNHLEERMPNVRKGDILTLGSDVYEVVDKIGEGGFAKIFLAEDNELDFGTRCLNGESLTSSFALKIEQPAQKWEFYICNELHNRLSKLKDPFDTRPGIVQISNGYFFANGSILVTQYQPHGTLLDLVNKCKKNNLHSESMIQHMEPVMVFMTIELLHMIEHMHQCQIIHGDIKPDNFLVLQFPRLPLIKDSNVVFGGTSRFVQLIDFGRSIDMKRYPAGTTFLTKVNTECFQCIEMKTNRPWTYQTDLFGLAGTIHVLVFNQYMNVYQEGGEWKMTSKFIRNWNTALWKKLFQVLLNVPSCDEIPDLSVIRKEFEQYFVNNLVEKYNTQCGAFNKTITSK